MAITLANITDIAPGLVGTPSNQVDAAINVAEVFVNPRVWGDKSDIGKAYLAAHLLTLGVKGGGSLGVTSEKVGDLSRSYAQPGMDPGSLDMTSYGKTFKWMMQTLLISPIVVS